MAAVIHRHRRNAESRSCATKRLVASRRSLLVAVVWCCGILLGGTLPALSALPTAVADSTSLPISSVVLLDSSAPAPSVFARIARDIGEQATAPFSLTSNQALWLGAGTLTTAGLFALDDDLDRAVRNLKRDHEWINTANPIITELGGTYGLVGLGAFAGYSLLAGDAKARETSLMAVEAFALSGLWVQVAKSLAGRERPYISYNYSHKAGGEWHGPLAQWTDGKHLPSSAYSSFPSGHTTTAFALATVFAEQYSDSPLVPIIAYTTASLVGISRMIENRHWASDVFVGACLGHLCAKQITSHSTTAPKKSHAAQQPTLQWYVGMAAQTPTIGIVVPVLQ